MSGYTGSEVGMTPQYLPVYILAIFGLKAVQKHDRLTSLGSPVQIKGYPALWLQQSCAIALTELLTCCSLPSGEVAAMARSCK